MAAVDTGELPARDATAAVPAGAGGESAGRPTAPEVSGAARGGALPVGPLAFDVQAGLSAVQRAMLGDARIRVRLNPPELGTMLVDVAQVDGAVTARLEVSSPAAHRAVLDSLGELRQALARSGSTVDRIDVVLIEPRGDSSRQQRDSSSQDGSAQDQPEPRRQNERRDGRPPRDDPHRSDREPDEGPDHSIDP